ncbi:GNAT family N-acetyltransferase [Shewanella mesophila]|nr:GNAT family N-acetyltransferase [Shewanella mesophila]
MGRDNPFTRYAFLHALEISECVGIASGWVPMHVMVYRDNELVAVMPMYLKTHSYGEYVFDWAWAQAYERHQLEYYPKLVSAIPFTPIGGTRIGFSDRLSMEQRQQLTVQLGDYLGQLLEKIGGSSWHHLFHSKAEQQLLANAGYLTRMGTQFHWHNRGYHDFDAFLAQMSSRKRKNILKERRQILGKGLSFQFIEGQDVSTAQLQHFSRCYQATYYKRSGHSGYLNLAFFTELVASMGDAIRLLIVSQETGQTQQIDQTEQTIVPVAAALYFVSEDILYGRYWGTLVELDGLHFETCYYQGIEYAIAHGLQTFDAGAQGEHKVLRGFEPIETYSAHEIMHDGFRVAIEDFTQQEKRQIAIYMEQLREVLPYKKA